MLLAFELWGCENEIPIAPTTDNFQGAVFIEGLLFPGQNAQIIINRAVPFFNENVTPQEVFARGAEVILTWPGGSEILKADSTFDKFRCRWNPFYTATQPIRAGIRYDLEVFLDGQTYRASTMVGQGAASIDEITYVEEFFDVYGGHDGVNVRFSDVRGERNYYRFQMNRKIDRSVFHAHVLDVIVSDCTADGEKFTVIDLGRSVFNDLGNDGGQLEVLVEVSFEYSEGDSTWIYIQSLDEKAADFYKELDEQLVTMVNPFVEPLFLNSKIEGGAIGVFGSAVLSDSVLFIYPQDNP